MDSVWQAGLAGLRLLEACGRRCAGISRLWELQKLHVSEMSNPLELVGTSFLLEISSGQKEQRCENAAPPSWRMNAVF